MARQSRRSPDIIMFSAALLLLTIGVIMVFSASTVTAYADTGDPYFYLKRQALWALLGIVSMLVLSGIDYRIWQKLAWPIFGVVFASLAIVWIPGIGHEVGGARRWLDIGPVRVQPSEFAKLSLVFVLAKMQSSHMSRNKKFVDGMLYPLLIMAVVFALIMKEPDLGTSVAIAVTAVVVVYIAGCNFGHLLAIGGISIPVMTALVFSAEYRLNRVTSFLNPWADPLGNGFHAVQSLMALGSGGIFGVGLGRSRQKYYYLPEQHTDFIFAVLGEELGLLGTVTILGLFFIFAWRGYRTAINCDDPFGSLVAVGITTQIIVQVLINIGVVSGSLPVTGITLPLISSGGSSLCITLAGIGILLNISKRASRSV